MEKIQAIKDFSILRNKKQLRGFLGTVSFSAKFTEKLSKELVPLLELLKKGNKWRWEQRHQQAFERVTELFRSWIMLYFQNSSEPYFLQTDASDYAVEIVIYQLDKEEEVRIIACGSGTLNGVEIAYYPTEKELLVLVWSLQKFRTILLGAQIIHRTDYVALTILQTRKLSSGRLTRRILATQDYRICVEHCSGTESVIADALSRRATVYHDAPETKGKG